MSSSILANPLQPAEDLQYLAAEVSKILQFSLLHHKRKKARESKQISASRSMSK
jgi:hypothetical protein